MGGFDFVGKKVERKNVMWSKSVRGWKSAWRGFNDQSYERERVGRWGRGGGWGGDDVDEGPSTSDTTAGGDSAEEGEGEEIDGFEYDMAL